MATTGNERRARPRVRANVPAQVVLTDKQEPITAQTVNLSGSGVYIALPKPILTGTRLRISLIIPYNCDGEIENRFFDFEGVVVRNEEPERREAEERFYVAVHFVDADEEEKEVIDRFVRRRLRGEV